MDTSALLFIDTETTGLKHATSLVTECSYAVGTFAEPHTFYPLRDSYRQVAVRSLNEIAFDDVRVGDLNHAFEMWGEHLKGYPFMNMAQRVDEYQGLRELHEDPLLTTMGQNIAFDLWMLTNNVPDEAFEFTTYKSIDLSSYSMGFFGKILDGNKPPSFAAAVSLINESHYPDKEMITQLPDHTAANDVRAMQQFVREIAKIQTL